MYSVWLLYGQQPQAMTTTASSAVDMVPALHLMVLVAQGAYSHSLAEWALTACSWFGKDLPRLKRQQKERNWESYYVEELRWASLVGWSCDALHHTSSRSVPNSAGYK